MHELQQSTVWLRILACLAAVVLVCGLKNYLIVIVSGTGLCAYLCPSYFDLELFFSYPTFAQLLEAGNWAQETFQQAFNRLVMDQWELGTSLLFAPVFEEVVYRGPLYLIRRLSHNALWWLIGTGLTLVFALSHGRYGLVLLPLIVLGLCSLWLIATTRRFWPSIALHFLHNFFFSSVRIYQSLWVSD